MEWVFWMSEQSKPLDKAANIVVKHSETEEFLVVQRSVHDTLPLRWEFPGGGVDEGEGIREAALRELAEETGLEGEVLNRGDSDTVELRERFLEIHVFEVKVEEKDVKLSREHRDFQWVSKEEIEKLDSEKGMQLDLEAINKW